MADSTLKFNNLCYLLKLLGCALNGTAPPEPDGDTDFEYIFSFAKEHNVANTAFYSVERLAKKPGQQLYKKWQNLRNKNYHKFLLQTMEYQSVTSEFKRAKIEFLPVKGLPVNNLYPKGEYRDMADLDFLIKGDLKRAGQAVASLGYTQELAGAFHHDEYSKPPFIKLELHREIVPIDSPFCRYYEDIFDRCNRLDDFEYSMTDEDFYIFSLVHLYKHYSSAGCGIRHFMDLYLLNKSLLPKTDRSYVAAELCKLGLTQFHRLASDIADKWFSDNPPQDFSGDELYILTSGAYGNSRNLLVNKRKGKTKLQLILSRLFPPVLTMQNIYPAVRRCVILLPLFYIKRIAVAPFKKRDKIRQEANFYLHNNNGDS